MHRSIEKDMIPVLKLKEEFEIVHQICISSLETLNDDILSDCLEPLPFKHPVAEVKYEALAWSSPNMKCGIVRKWKLSKEI